MSLEELNKACLTPRSVWHGCNVLYLEVRCGSGQCGDLGAKARWLIAEVKTTYSVLPNPAAIQYGGKAHRCSVF